MPPIPFWSQYRTIVLDESARRFVDSELSRPRRFDDQWSGVEWRLARKPEIGVPRWSAKPNEYLFYVFSANEVAATRELWVLYSYDQNEVHIHAACFGS